MRIFFIFGYLKSGHDDFGGGTCLDIFDMLELEEDKPATVVNEVAEELKRLIVQGKLKKNMTESSSGDGCSSFEQFFGEFLVPKRTAGPKYKDLVERLNELFEKKTKKIFAKR